jgi:hypothetical protein
MEGHRKYETARLEILIGCQKPDQPVYDGEQIALSARNES